MKTKLLYLLLLLPFVTLAQSPVSPIGPVATQFYYDTSDSSHWTHDVRGYFKLNTGGGGGGTWGSITGTLSNQIDLQAALDAKQNLLMFGNGIITTSGVTGLGGPLIRTTIIDNTGFDFTIADNTGTGLYLIPNFKGFFADDGAGHAADLLIQGTESGKATAGFFMDALNGATVKSIDGTDNAVGHGIWVEDTKDRVGLNAKSQPNYTGTGTGSLQYTTRHYVDSVATGGGGTGANPTASIVFTPVNGSATSFIRSDGAPKADSTVIRSVANSYSLAGMQTKLNNYVLTTRTVNGKALSSNIVLGLASSDFANQGTTTTVLHGNASGNPSFAQIGIADLSATGTPSSATFLRGDNTWGTPVGTLTASNFIFNEVPSGTINGSNVTFTLANTPTSGTVQIYKNGLRQTLTADYTISGSTITFSTAPSNTGFSDVLIADYLK